MTDSSLVLVANAGDGSISTFRLSGDSIERLFVSRRPPGCSSFAVDAARDLVYAAVKGGSDAEPAGIVTLRLDRESGRLDPVSRLDLPDGGMNYLALCRDGAGLLGASYGGGYGISCSVADGVVGDPVSRIEFPNLHSVLPSADGRFAYFVSLGADLVAQYALTDDLRLVPLEPATVAAPEGSGPRHLVLNEARTLYVLTDSRHRCSTSHATPRREPSNCGTPQMRSTRRRAFATAGSGPIRARSTSFGAPTCTSATAADGCGARSGRRAPSVRWESRTMARCRRPSICVKTEPQPRGFALSPDGAHLIAAGEGSTPLSLSPSTATASSCFSGPTTVAVRTGCASCDVVRAARRGDLRGRS